MKEFIKAYYASSAVWGRKPTWTLHAWAALILPWEKQIETHRKKREKQMVWRFFSVLVKQLHWQTDWHLLLWHIKSFIPTKSKMLCLLPAGVLYPAASSLLFPSRPKDAMRALKKRLSGNKNYREVMLALTVREVLTFSWIFLNCETGI